MKQIGHYTYDEINCLGQGAYGKVYEGINTLNNETVAIKRLDLVLFEKDKYLRKQIVQEIEIMSKLNHKNIVHFVELLATKKSLFIVTEMCRSGDLKTLISSKNINEQQAIDIMSQIVEGFKELIKNGVIHRDMKPANVLNDIGTVKIADFGFAKYVENYSSQLLKSCVGSPLYMAPQVLERHHYSTKCDIWSLGVIFYEMVHFDVPWKGRDEDDLLHNIKTQPLQMKPDLSPISKQFLTMTLVIDEESRASWNQLFDMFSTITISQISNEDISEEAIQRVPTWVQKNHSKLEKTQEETKTLLKDLLDQRHTLAYQHFVLAECYTEQINDRTNKQLQQENIKCLINKLSKEIVQKSTLLIKNTVETFQKINSQLSKGALWKMQDLLNQEHNYYIQMQQDVELIFENTEGLETSIEKAKEELQRCQKSQVLYYSQTGCIVIIINVVQLSVIDQYFKTNKMASANQQFSLFQDYTLKKVSFVVDNIKYDFDNQKMMWTTDVVEVEENLEDEQNKELLKKKGLKQIEVKAQVEQNEKTIKKLQDEIQQLNDNINKYQEKLQQSQAEQNQLIDEYIHEHLETEKVKGARERLDKLKRELGLM